MLLDLEQYHWNPRKLNSTSLSERTSPLAKDEATSRTYNRATIQRIPGRFTIQDEEKSDWRAGINMNGKTVGSVKPAVHCWLFSEIFHLISDPFISCYHSVCNSCNKLSVEEKLSEDNEIYFLS